MAIRKEDLHKLIDQIPEDNYQKALERLKDLLIPEEELTEEEAAEIEKARKEIEAGEYATLDDLYKAIYGDDKE